MSDFIRQKKPIILASSSSIRSKLLHSIGLEFLAIPSECDEELIKQNHLTSDFIELGYKLARQKALEVSQKHPNHFVIAADQLCIIEGKIIDKPLSHACAVEHLRLLRGKQHQQLVCMCIAINEEIVWQHHEHAELTMHSLSDETIEHYLKKEQPYHSCGAYHYESLGKWLFKQINGNEETILGLPLFPLMNALVELEAVTI